jgi:hypothetical protein
LINELKGIPWTEATWQKRSRPKDDQTLARDRNDLATPKMTQIYISQCVVFAEIGSRSIHPFIIVHHVFSF